MLSIPSFRWFYFEDSDIRVRLSGTSCEIIGPHFIRFGGWRVNNGGNPPWDPICMNPVSILDLNSFSWTDRFDPNAEPYKSPTKIDVWNKGNASPVRGWDSGVQEIFSRLNSTTSPESVNRTSTPTPTSHVPEPDKEGSGPGRTIGGVLGGLVGLALVLVAALIIIKRIKKKNTSRGREDWERIEMSADHEPRPPVELGGIPLIQDYED